MNSYIVKGPKINGYFDNNISLSRIFYNGLKKRNQDDIVAVENGTGEEISSGKFFHTSIKLAQALRNLGVTMNSTICIISSNNWKFLATVVSAFFNGSTTAAMNPNVHTDELRHELMISKPEIVFITRHLSEKVKEMKKECNFLKYVVILDDKAIEDEFSFDELTSREVDYTLFEVEEMKGDAAILYSSGTTGLPKGVIITQQNIISALKYIFHSDFLDIREGSVLSGILPFFHIFGFVLSLICLLGGSKLIIMDKFKPDVFLMGIMEHKINTLVVVPSILVFLAKSPIVANYDLCSLDDILCGAAPLGREEEELILKRLNIPVRQIYGLTETFAITCMPKNVQKYGSVGKVVADHEVKIVCLDSGKILGPHKHGEICFKGPCVMKGYKSNDAATSAIMDEDGFLHTGDVGYFDNDGYLYIIDRIKNLIKYKGFQVPPALLEDILNKHPAVKDVAVIGRPDETAGELPTAFIVKQDNTNVTEDELINYVSGKVSTEKRLSGGIIFTNEIPRNSNGKILKKDLQKLL